jgi:hypothetical protein
VGNAAVKVDYGEVFCCATIRVSSRVVCSVRLLSPVSLALIYCACAALCLPTLQVLQGADCRRADFADRARLRGSFRDAAAPDALGRLVGAYEVCVCALIPV